MNYLQEIMYRRAEAEYERARDNCGYCEPQVIGVHQEYEGEGEYSESAIYNCENCDDRECEYWSEHNVEDVEDEEERILDPDWAEFFEATCERYRKDK